MADHTFTDGRSFVSPATGFTVEAVAITYDDAEGQFFAALLVLDYVTEDILAFEKLAEIAFPTREAAEAAARAELHNYQQERDNDEAV